jgi:hypothetical protein
VRCRGDQAEVVGLQREPGFTTKDYDPGPAGEIQVVLESPLAQVEVKATCSNGLPVPRVKIS